MKFRHIILAATIGFICSHQALASEPVNYKNITAALVEMAKSDQSERRKYADIEAKYGHNSEQVKEFWKKQDLIDKTNLARLEKIIAKIGWPAISKVGEVGSLAAFVVIQHSDIETQKRYIPLLRDAVKQHEAKPANLALMEDRILTSEGKPQRYGSQVTKDPATGKNRFYEIEDERNVDVRRAQMDLGPLADYAKIFGIDYIAPK